MVRPSTGINSWQNEFDRPSRLNELFHREQNKYGKEKYKKICIMFSNYALDADIESCFCCTISANVAAGGFWSWWTIIFAFLFACRHKKMRANI